MSAVVRPSRVAASPVALECVLHSTLLLGNSVVVFGRLVHAAVREDGYLATDAPDGGVDHAGAVTTAQPRIELLAPLSRLGGDEWGRARDVTELRRVPLAQWPAQQHVER